MAPVAAYYSSRLNLGPCINIFFVADAGAKVRKKTTASILAPRKLRFSTFFARLFSRQHILAVAASVKNQDE